MSILSPRRISWKIDRHNDHKNSSNEKETRELVAEPRPTRMQWGIENYIPTLLIFIITFQEINFSDKITAFNVYQILQPA